MGRQAKLKQLRREAAAQLASSPQTQPQTDSDPTEFVQQLQKQGYQLQQIDRCPEVPENRTKPQV